MTRQVAVVRHHPARALGIEGAYPVLVSTAGSRRTIQDWQATRIAFRPLHKNRGSSFDGAALLLDPTIHLHSAGRWRAAHYLPD